MDRKLWSGDDWQTDMKNIHTQTFIYFSEQDVLLLHGTQQMCLAPDLIHADHSLANMCGQNIWHGKNICQEYDLPDYSPLNISMCVSLRSCPGLNRGC